MKYTTALKRILTSDKSKQTKILKLYNLAFQQMPNSIAQNEIKKAIEELQKAQ